MSPTIARFLDEPTGPHFQAAWRSVTKTGRKVDFPRLTALLADGGAHEVLEELSSLPLWLRLSPRVHDLAARAAELTAQSDDAEVERYLFSRCAAGILASGDGCPDSPYLAVQAADEAVILAILGREPLSQAVIEARDRILDVVICRDGGEVCFDVTHLLRLPLQKRVKPRKTAAVR